MTACTDEERRFVAAALRAYDGRGADADTIGEVTAIVIGAGDAGGWSWKEIYDRLADLIEPACDKGEKDIQPNVTCDREALLALVDELEEETGSVCGVCMGKTALRIREACEERAS